MNKNDPRVKDCCKQDENRKPHHEFGMAQGVTCEKCVVCGCRHFEMNIDATSLSSTIRA